MHEHLLQVEETLNSQVQSVSAKVNLANENATRALEHGLHLVEEISKRGRGCN